MDAMSTRLAGGVVGVALVRDQHLGTLAGPAGAGLVDRIASSRANSCGLSPAWPGVSRIDNGRPGPSTAR